MNLSRWMGVIILLALGSISGIASANQTLLEVTFDDKTIDQPIGAGGGAIGEPDYVAAEIEAYVRATPFDSPSLELHNTTTDNETVWFSLPGSAVSTGLAVIIMDLWFYGSGPGWTSGWTVYTADYQSLLTMRLLDDRRIHVGAAGTYFDYNNYPIGRSFPVLIALDMDADTYSIWMDGTLQGENLPLDLTGRDFKAIWFDTGHDCDPANKVSVDQIRVLDWMPSVPTSRTTWGRVRALYR
jgi:hypothetical protein